MRFDAIVVGTILGMAAVTYATKAGGLWLMGQVEVSDRVEAWLNALPGAIVVSIIAPTIVNGGPVEWTAGAVVLLVAWKLGSIIASMAIGVGLVWLLRTVPVA